MNGMSGLYELSNDDEETRRTNNITEIEKNIMDLARLHQDLQFLIESQQESIDTINTNVMSALTHVTETEVNVATVPVRHGWIPPVVVTGFGLLLTILKAFVPIEPVEPKIAIFFIILRN